MDDHPAVLAGVVLSNFFKRKNFRHFFSEKQKRQKFKESHHSKVTEILKQKKLLRIQKI